MVQSEIGTQGRHGSLGIHANKLQGGKAMLRKRTIYDWHLYRIPNGANKVLRHMGIVQIEDLQSINEELTVAKANLQTKVKELKQATDDLMHLMSSAETATIFLDRQLNIKRFTPPTTAVLNLQSADIGRPLKEIAQNFADDTMLKECQLVLESAQSLEREVQTDELKHYLRRILPYRTNEDDVGGVVITFVDLTHRKNVEIAQRENDARHFAEMYEIAERLQAILNTAAYAIMTIDLLGNIDQINQATERLFQYSRDELIGKNIGLLMPAIFNSEPAQGPSQAIPMKLAELDGYPRELLAQRKDGSTFPVNLALSRVGHLGLYTGILRDITIKKQLQAHILEIATDEQSRIGQELHDGTQQELTGLSLYAGVINDLLSKASHRSVEELEEWILRDVDFQRIKQALAKLTNGLIQANHHVHELAHGIMPMQVDAVDLQAALADLASSTNANPKISCQFELVGSGSVCNNAVATQLYRIAQESLTNSLKHGNASEIRISLTLSSSQTALEISDNGVGFDLKEKENKSSESGMGLRIMKYRASILGGELQVSRNGSNGTTVLCTIPTIGDLK
jgi:PAS domain S-box-containing protein